MGRSSTWKADIMFLMRSPPKMRKRLSSRLRKYRVEPGSPWRPARPRSWLSMRRDSWRSVPTTCRPPSSTTFFFSSLVTALNSASTFWKASRSFCVTASSVGAFSQATLRRSSASSSISCRSPQAATAVSTASATSASASLLRPTGYSPSRTFHLSAPLVLSSISTRLTTRGISASRILRRAMNSGLPPSRMSVPRPAMLVAMVTAPRRPL
mmetsp:Transcript_38121/g.107714  ORF Transcript_38121/g.107714 Transcript_38121/m.107714 type:complete len:211 (+) Transcript_38121:765-1397(+)